MIVRQTQNLPISYLYGVGGAVAVLLIGVYTARNYLMATTVTQTCEAHYMQGVRFSFTRQSGEPLTTAELQGKLAGLDWGLNDNVQIRKLDGAPAPFILEVDLKSPQDQTTDGREATRSGMGFVWQPKAARKATAGCLSYSVWVPEDFDYGNGGLLPGFFGEETVVSEATEEKPEVRSKPFSVRLRWRPDGGLDLVSGTQDINPPQAFALTAAIEPKLERGKWMKVEQEFVLNTPGEADGGLRLWVNGAMVAENGEVAYRAEAAQHLTAVNVDLHFTNQGLEWGPAKKSTKIRLSPIELRLE